MTLSWYHYRWARLHKRWHIIKPTWKSLPLRNCFVFTCSFISGLMLGMAIHYITNSYKKKFCAKVPRGSYYTDLFVHSCCTQAQCNIVRFSWVCMSNCVNPTSKITGQSQFLVNNQLLYTFFVFHKHFNFFSWVNYLRFACV